ncbi:MAG: 2,3-bisphosphoglycerate-independent phosphoglycerate mutase [Pseudomonadales bacterium]
MKRTTLLVILDGFGYREATESNAIAAADAPVWAELWRDRPHTLISGSGRDVGLPAGQMGNSEVGHMNLGAGRVVYQDLTRITHAIEQGEFSRNHAFRALFERLRETGGALHVMGLLSPGGVHSHEDQIFSFIEVAAHAGIEKIYLHAFLDGRDTPPRSAGSSLAAASALFERLGRGQVASVSGRFFAMDRDRRWDRVERAYNLMVRGEAPFHAETALEGLESAYARDESDEFVQPTAIHATGELPVRMHDGDGVVFMNFRADRARQITRGLIDSEFADFARRSTVRLADFVMLTRYADDIDTSCAFEPQGLSNTLGEYLAEHGRSQLRIAETEKYAHVTFFFSGGREDPYEGERRILIPSPKVTTYDECPEMSAVKVTDELVKALRSNEFDFIVCNYANGDMVGHTGNFGAAVRAVETLDACLGRLVATIDDVGGQMLITADHGNVEQMEDPDSGQAHTAHTSEPVPLVYVGPQAVTLESGGVLADIAPTVLTLMHMDIPVDMTGRPLARIRERRSA